MIDWLVKRSWVAPIIASTIYAFFLGPNLLFPDEKEYFSIAHNLISSGIYSIDGIQPTAYRPPSYPLFLAFLMLISTSVVWLKLIGLSMWVASALLARRIAEILFDELAGNLAVLMFCAYGVGIYTASTLYPQTFVSLTLMASIFLMVRFDSDVAAIPVLVLQGIASLAVPNFMFTIPIFLIALCENRKSIIRSFVGLLIVAIVFAPWIYRNYETFGKFIPLSTSGGINLLLGNSPNASPNAGVNVDLSRFDLAAASMSEVAKNEYFTRSALDWIVQNKGDAAKLFFAKLLNWFNFRNDLATDVGGQSIKAFALAVTYYPLLLLASCSLLYPFGRRLWFLPAIYLVAAISYAIFFTRIRFRVPFDDVIIIMAAGCASSLCSLVLKKIRAHKLSALQS